MIHIYNNMSKPSTCCCRYVRKNTFHRLKTDYMFNILLKLNMYSYNMIKD